MKRKYTDAELEEFVLGEKNGQPISQDKLNEMAKDILLDEQSLYYVEHLQNKIKLTEDDKNIVKSVVSQVLNSPRIKEELKKIKPLPKAWKDKPIVKDLSFGQIFSTKLPENWIWKAQETRWVVVLSDVEGAIDENLPDVKVAPISFEKKFATDMDVVIKNDPKVLNGYSFMIRFGDVQNLFVHQLGDYYGMLPRKYFANLKQGWKYAAGLTAQPAENSGSAIEQDDDPRLFFILEENDLTEYMRKPVNDLIAYWEEQEEDENVPAKEETPGNVIVMDSIIPEAWLRVKEEYALAAAKEKQFSLSEGKLFTIFESKRLKLRLHIAENGMQLRLQFSKAEKKYQLSIKNLEGVELLAPSSEKIIPLHPVDKFINRSLRIEIKTALFTKTIRTKFYHGYSDSR